MPLPDPKPKVYAQDDCAFCHDRLLDCSDHPNPLEFSYVIDDVQLRCGHHFHQSCIIEQALSSPAIRQRCVTCRAGVLNSRGQFIVTIKTENGHVSTLNINRDIDEMAHFNAHPNLERSLTFLSLMSQMEFVDAEKFLKGEDGTGERPLSPNMRYETGGQTAMHMAAYNDDVEGVQLLLRYGANRGLKDDDGQTALDNAKQVDAKGVIALLKD